MENLKKYCKKCGSKLTDTECNYFDEYTGEKIHDLICPNEKCEANCDFFGHKYKRITWWNTDVRCEKCGYTPQDY